MIAPWVWAVVDDSGPRPMVVAHGVQWTRPHATPKQVAAERSAAVAWRYLWGDRAGRWGEAVGLRVRVRRGSDTGVQARVEEVRVASWLPG